MFVFSILTVLLIASALGVVLSHNPINSALCLILNMMGIACLFASLDAHFLAAVQIIVYAGAVMVLVLFVLMLLNIKVEAPKPASRFFVYSCFVVSAVFLYYGVPVIFDAFSGISHAPKVFDGSMEALGKELYTTHIFPFEASSILLMAAVAGAVMLAKRKIKQ